jgi:hypothetical protein
MGYIKYYVLPIEIVFELILISKHSAQFLKFVKKRIYLISNMSFSSSCEILRPNCLKIFMCSNNFASDCHLSCKFLSLYK